jgi:hypothetical protein
VRLLYQKIICNHAMKLVTSSGRKLYASQTFYHI